MRISAARLQNLIKTASVREVKIWKDVDGALARDPLVADGLCLDEISHGEAVVPAMRRRIPIVVRNSLETA